MFGTKRARIGSLVAILGIAVGVAVAAAISGAASARSVQKDAESRDGDSRITAAFTPPPAAHRAATAAPAAPAAEVSQPPAVSAGPPPSAATPAAPAKPATQLVGVEPTGGPDGTVVRLRTNGAIEGVETSVLASPARLVLDLTGIHSSTAPATLAVDSKLVQRVRVATHGAETRVVIDVANADVLGQRQIVPVADGLVVALGAGANVEQAVAAARTNTAAAVAVAATASAPEKAAAPSPAKPAETAAPTPTPAPAAVKAVAAAKPAPAKPEPSSPGSPKTAAAAPAAPASADTASIDQLEEGGLLDGKEYVGRRISLDFKDVDIRDVLRLIADVSDLNIIAGDEVSGNVTIRLVDVPWDQALDVILLTKGLGFVRVGNVLRIAPGETLKSEDEARLQERRAKEKLEDLLVKLQPVNYANVKEVSKLVKRLLTARGSVDTDERTNTIIIKDIASVIDESTALIKAIDTQTPQVMIEARIVEASLDFSQEVGLEWGVGSQPNQAEKDFTIGGIKPITKPDTKFPYNNANNVVVTNPMSLTPAGLINLGSFLLDDRFNIDLRLAAAELNGEGKVISSPRVVTLDNREAKIEQGVSIPFQTFENGDAQLEFIDAVLSLKVTPHITADRSIIMSVEVTRNAPDDSVSTPTGSPAIAKNQAKTETLVKDGQTLVLGGIYVIDTAENQQRVPGFWKLPILGNAFKNNGVRDRRKELLIFVQPSVVVSPQQASAS